MSFVISFIHPFPNRSRCKVSSCRMGGGGRRGGGDETVVRWLERALLRGSGRSAGHLRLKSCASAVILRGMPAVWVSGKSCPCWTCTGSRPVSSAERAGVHQNAETALSRMAPLAANASSRGVSDAPPGPADAAGEPAAHPADAWPMSSPRTKTTTLGGAQRTGERKRRHKRDGSGRGDMSLDRAEMRAAPRGAAAVPVRQ